jgi:hypothetical protein
MDQHSQRVVVPRADPAVVAKPFMGLSSGYVQRGQAHVPKQGDRAPWQAKQNYFSDLRALKWSRIDDGVLRFDE